MGVKHDSCLCHPYHPFLNMFKKDMRFMNKVDLMKALDHEIS